MSSLTNETNIITLPGNRIILTTHRLLYVTEFSAKEILLANLVSYEIVQKKSGFLRGLFLVTAVPVGIWLLLYIGRCPPFGDGHYIRMPFELYGSIMCSLLIGLFSRVYTQSYVRICDRYSAIEFQEKEVADPGLAKFLDMLTIESEKRKK